MKFFHNEFAFAEGEPPVVIAEAGVNHNGDVALARRMIDAAVEAGADIVKFQAFKTEKEISRFAMLAPYQQASSDAANQYDLCKALELPHSAFAELKDYSTERGIGFLCSAFDFDSIDFLVDDLKVEALKIASGEITNFPLLDRIAQKGVGVILSTGGSTLAEIGEAVERLQRFGCPELALLHCVSNYPAVHDQLNLKAVTTLAREFSLPTGFSDHSQGVEASIAAVALGARVIEKHFTLDRHLPGPDHLASAEPDELHRLVAGVRLTQASLGDGVKRAMPCELANVPLIRRSLVANGALKRGDRLTREMVDVKRPAEGIDPRQIDEAIGRELRRDLDYDQPITWDDLV